MFKKIKFKKLLMFAPLMTLMFCFNAPQNDDEKMQTIMAFYREMSDFLQSGLPKQINETIKNIKVV